MTNEEIISPCMEDDDRSHGFGRGATEPLLDVPHLTQPEEHLAEDHRRSKIEVINKTCSSSL